MIFNILLKFTGAPHPNPTKGALLLIPGRNFIPFNPLWGFAPVEVKGGEIHLWVWGNNP